MSFVDIENEKIEIKDLHDFDYMMSNISNEKPMVVEIKNKK